MSAAPTFFRETKTGHIYLITTGSTKLITVGLKGPRGGLKGANVMCLSEFLGWARELQDFLGVEEPTAIHTSTKEKSE